MEIEVPVKEPRGILQENKSALFKRQESEAAGSPLGKMSDRTMLYDFGKREVRPYYYS